MKENYDNELIVCKISIYINKILYDKNQISYQLYKYAENLLLKRLTRE